MNGRKTGPEGHAARFDPPRRACPLCGCPRIVDERYQITRYAVRFGVGLCRGCGFMFMNPPLSDGSIAALYGEEYYAGCADYRYHDERKSEPFSRFVWDARIRKIRRFVPGGNFLDVGCSFGGFLRSASKHFTPHGIEISVYAGRYARESTGGSVHIGTLDDHPFPPGHFDVITLIEVLEHIKEPAAAIATCHDLLRKGGLLVIQTANMEGLQARIGGPDYAYFMPGHLSYFSRRNLTGILVKKGFSGVRTFHPVEFGLLPKLRKSRGSFRRPADYLAWIRISLYHLMSLIHWGNFAATSSMVVYARK